MKILEQYKHKFPDKITIIKNPTNLGAGQSRNRGVLETQTTIPSDYLWIVDGDDYLSDKNVLNDIHAFVNSHSNYDIINVGITYCGKYSVGKVGWPIASWGRIIKPCAYVSSPSRNIPHGNDVYAHFVMFDTVEDAHIGEFNRNCYVCPKNGMHRNNTEKNMNVFTTIGEYLMQHDFKKKSVIDSMKSSESGVWKKLCDANSKFHPKFQPNIKRNVSILMASFPYRKKWMLKCIDQLIPQCDNFYLWLNEYKEIPNELTKYDQSKLHITLGKQNLKENGRYVFLNNPEL